MGDFQTSVFNGLVTKSKSRVLYCYEQGRKQVWQNGNNNNILRKASQILMEHPRIIVRLGARVGRGMGVHSFTFILRTICVSLIFSESHHILRANKILSNLSKRGSVYKIGKL